MNLNAVYQVPHVHWETCDTASVTDTHSIVAAMLSWEQKKANEQ
jgi:hypothetical protein